MARKEHPQGKGAEKRVAKKVALMPVKSVKLPKLPKFTAQEYAIDDDSPAPIVRMTIAQWAQVPRNPYQKKKRDTGRKLEHLYVFRKEHATARMGIYPNGDLCKIDCHSRGYLYVTYPERVDRPPTFLNVECYPVRDEAHAAERFKIVDSRKTAKNAADDVHGAFRLVGIPTNSDFFETGTDIKATLGYAYEILHRANTGKSIKYTTVPLETQVAAFKPALVALDAVDVQRKFLEAPFIGSFLLAYTKYGKVVVPFFSRVNEGTHGQRRGKMMCPIAAIEKERDQKWSGGGQDEHLEKIKQVLGALAKYMEGKHTSPGYVPAMSMQKIMKVKLDRYLRDKNVKRGDGSGGKGFTR
jgi:hypothetical protein